MQSPLQITFRHLESSEAVEADIRERAAKLDSFCDSVISCRVVVEAPRKHKQQGGLFHARIDITLPGGQVVVNREPDLHHAHEDPYVAIRDAFNAAYRQLEDYVRRRKVHVKTHETVPHGWISVLFPEEDYGRIDTADGDDIYFHRNSILNANFDTLEVGTEVRFVVEAGDEGPQATSVKVIGKHHIIGLGK